MFGGSTNYIGTIIVVIIFVVVLGYLIWKPYLRGQKVHAVVDGHVHPVSGDDKDLVFVCRFVYREQKGGKRQFCYSRRRFDLQEEARKEYPKGKEVDLRVFENSDFKDYPNAMILGDKVDMRRTIFYTLALLLGASAVLVGNLFLDAQFRK